MNIIGLDVGFSKNKDTSGVARLLDGKVYLGRATSAASSRYKILGEDPKCEVVAIDAPFLPTMHWDVRPCERLFTLGLFQRRCKPGLSHIKGTGRQFRQAGYDTAKQLDKLRFSKRDIHYPHYPQVWKKKAVVEAFPNAFLGVLIPDTTYKNIPTLRRGHKFDWLYDQCLEMGVFKNLSDVLDETGRLFNKCVQCTDHEERAALICLLTAGCVAKREYFAVGDKHSGYFFLPSISIWADWSKNELLKQIGRVAPVELWIDGKLMDFKKIKQNVA